MSIRRFDIEPLLPLMQRGFTLLAPNNRSVDGILREFANHSRGDTAAWSRPPVFAIDIYIQQIWQLAASQGISPFDKTLLLSRFDEQEIWLQIVKSSHDEYPLLNSEETANSAARSYQFFKQWHVAESDAIKRYNNAVDFQAFLGWSAKFEARCNRLSVASLSDAGRLLALNIHKLKPLLPEKIALVNFKQPPPLYAELFEALSTICEFEWRQESDTDEEAESLLDSAEAIARKFQSPLEEVQACLQWSSAIAAKHPDSHIGIVADPSRALDPLIEETLFREFASGASGKFDVARCINRLRSQRKLSELTDFDNALGILAMNQELIDSERFCRILQSPHTTGAEQERAARLAFEVYFRKHGEAEIRLSNLRQLLLHSEQERHCPVLAATLLEFSELARHQPSHQPLRHWLELFGRQLHSLGWLQAHPAATRKRLSQQWQQSMQRLASASSVLGNLSIESALGKLRTFLSQSNADLHFDDRLQITLVDIEEAQDLVFDHVWLLAADDRNWPPAINPVPFLPYSLQQELDMPASTHQQQLATATGQLRALRAQTQAEMVISYHALEEELRIRPSPLLHKLDFAQAGDEPRGLSQHGISAQPITLERFEDPLRIPLQPDERVSGGTSLLSNQSNCPFRAFARNRLNASGLEEFSHGLSPMARGIALHKALENIGLKFVDSKTLHGLSGGDREKLLKNGAAVALAYLRRHYPETMTPAFAEIEQYRLAALLAGFLQLELQRTEFSVLHNEEAIIWRHSRLALEFRIDRIDRLQDGSLALVDYKTGKQTNYKWFDDRPDDMQLPLYQLALSDSQERAVSATLIFQLNAENIGLVGPLEPADFGAPVKVSSQARHFEGGWSELQSLWNNTIYALVEEFETGLLAVAPTRGTLTCQYCDLDPLCRIGETSPDTLELGEGEL